MALNDNRHGDTAPESAKGKKGDMGAKGRPAVNRTISRTVATGTTPSSSQVIINNTNIILNHTSSDIDSTRIRNVPAQTPIYIQTTDGSVYRQFGISSISVSGNYATISHTTTEASSGTFSTSNSVTISFGDVSDGSGTGDSLPDGGTTGQLLAKASNTDDDVEWVDEPTGTTDLSIGIHDSTRLEIESSSGNDVTLPAATTTDAGVMSAADKIKLNGITTATGEANVQSDWDATTGDALILNKPTTISSAQIAKLSGIETSATADQTGTEIKTAYESESDTNAFTDALKTKLDGIAAGTGEANVQSDWNQATNTADDYIKNKPGTITTAQVLKLTGIATGAEVNEVTQSELDVAFNNATISSGVITLSRVGNANPISITIPTSTAVADGVIVSASIDQTTQIVTLTTSESDTITFDLSVLLSGFLTQAQIDARAAVRYTDAEKTKLSGIATGAEVNVVTNLGIDNRDTDSIDITSSTGSDVTIPSATASLSGLMSSTDKDNLNDLVTASQGQTAPTNLGIANHGVTTLDITSSTGTDVTVPAAAQDATGLMAALDKTKLDGIATAAEVNVQADWGITSASSDAFILNKPTVITATERTKLTGIATGAEVNVQSSWTATTGDAQILNKPTTITAAQTSKLAGIATAAEVNVQSDWDQTTDTVDDFIKNKPTAQLVPDGGTSGQLLVKNSGTDYDTHWVNSMSVGGDTDLSISNRGTTTLDITSSNGDNATVPAATSTLTGLMAAADKTKLTGIATGAEVNVQSDWTATTGDALILNKPTTISAAQTTKLSGIETAATADQTGSEIKTAYEAESDTNAFTDTLKTKLDGIATGATAGEANVQSDWGVTSDSSDAFIKNKPTTISSAQTTKLSGIATSAEVNVQSDWNENTAIADGFIKNKPTIISTAERAKLTGIETAATADQTGAQIKTAYEGESDTNAFTDALKTKLDGIATGATAGEANVQSDWDITSSSSDAFIKNKPTTISTAQATKLSGIATGAEVNVQSSWTANSGDAQILNKPTVITAAERTKLTGIETSATADQTGAEIKTAYEAESNTNAYTDTEKSKLGSIATGAEINIQSDWSQSTSTADDFIKNKPITITSVERTKLTAIETGATADQTAGEIKTAYESNTNTNAYTDAEKTKLGGIATGAEVNVQSSWTATTGDALILNKPTTISTAQATKLAGIATGAEINVQSNWNATSGDALILNKPTTITPSQTTKLSGIETSATADQTGAQIKTAYEAESDTNAFTDALKTKLDSLSATGEMNVQSDWTEDDDTEDSYIDNKPSDSQFVPDGGTSGQLLVKNSATDYDTHWVNSMSVGGDTDLSITNRGTTTLDITSSNGDNATVPAATSALTGLMAAADKTKLTGIATGAEVNVQADWNDNVAGSDSFIKNKPTTISSAQTTKLSGIAANAEMNVQSDWNQATATSDEFIKNKPTTISSAQTTKLSGIETAATADQTGAQIKTAYEGESDTNAFTDTLKTKLDGIATGATAGDANVQSDWDATTGDAFIKNKPTTISTAQTTKLSGIETSATADQTAIEIKTAYESNDDTNAFTDIDKNKLNLAANVQADWTELSTSDASFIKNKPTTITAVQTSKLSGISTGAEVNVQSSWTATTGDALILNKPTVITAAERTKLGGISTAAEVNVQSDWSQATGTADDFIKNKPTVITAAERAKLTGIGTSAEANVQSDWTVSDATSDGFIKNKPTTISTAQATKLAGIATAAEVNVQSDWNQATATSDDFIKNKPTIITAAQTAKLAGIEIAAEVNVQSDWNQATAGDDSFIKNKPTIITATERTKLTGIATGAEANVQSNWTATTGDAFILNKPTTISTAQATKLSGIETSATADQSATEIKTAYESNTNTNPFTDALKTKLDGIATGATAGEANVQSDWSVTDSNSDTFIKNKPTTISTAQATKLAGIATGAEVNVQSNWNATSGDALILNKPTTITPSQVTKLAGIETDATADQTGAQIKTAYEAESDTNAFTDALKTKLDSLSATGEMNVQSDWTEDDDTEDSYIDNKPSDSQFVPDGGTSGQLLVKNSATDYDTHWVNSMSVGGDTDLSISNRGTTTLDITSSNGDNATVPAATSTLTGLMAAADKTKLTGIEASATADQSATEIKTAYESNTNTNAYTDTEKSKLGVIATGAEVNVQSNWTATTGDAFILNKPTVITAAERTKLTGIATAAEVNVQSDWNQATATSDDFIKNKPTVITATERTKITGIAANAEVNVQSSWTATTGDAFILNKPTTITAAQTTKLSGIETSATADQSATEIKTAYESNTNTNPFTDTLKTKLDGIATGATAGEANVQSDWDITSASSDAFIKNKPTTISSAQATKLAGIATSADVNVQVDWNVSDSNSDSFVKNKPTTITTAQTSKLGGIATGAEVNVQSDWNENTSTSDGFIKNKPTIISTAERAKLTGIETSATADQTSAEIKTAYESNSNTNAFTDSLKTKLDGVAIGAEVNVQSNWTANSGDAQILNKPTVITATERTKLTGIETSATADQTGAEIKTAYEAQANTNAYTDTEKTKLGGIATAAEVNVQVDWAQTTATSDAFIKNKPTVITAVERSKLTAIETAATADQTAGEIKTAYESNSNTNAYTDTEKTKLSGIATAAEVNIQADWNITSTSSDAFIKNKPTIISTAERTKLTGIETGATADQTGAQIKTAYEAESDTNAFTDTLKTKLDGIATGAQVNEVTQSELDVAFNNATISSGVITLSRIGNANPISITIPTSTTIADGVVVSASINQSTQIVTLTTSESDTITFDLSVLLSGFLTQAQVDARAVVRYTDAEKTKLSGIGTGAEVNVQADWNATTGDAQILNKPTTISSAQTTKLSGIETSATSDQTGAEIKTAYEGQDNTNAYTDAEKTKLESIEAGTGESNVQSDWDITDTSSDAFIKNKPGEANQSAVGSEITTIGPLTIPAQHYLGQYANDGEANVDKHHVDDFYWFTGTNPRFRYATTEMASGWADVTHNTANQISATIRAVYPSDTETRWASFESVTLAFDNGTLSPDALGTTNRYVVYTSDDSSVHLVTAYSTTIVFNSGLMPAADKEKLDGIDAGVNVNVQSDWNESDDETDSYIKNKPTTITSAQAIKLDSIETSATADQTGAEIKTAYESNSDTNAFTDSIKTKLDGIATGAEVNVQSDWNATSGDAFIENKPANNRFIPSGGSDGQVLSKSSDTDYATEWTERFDLHEHVETQISEVNVNDRMLVSDESESSDRNRYMEISDLSAHILDLHNRIETELTTFADNDRMFLTDESASGTPPRYATLINLRKYFVEDGTYTPTITGLRSTQSASSIIVDWGRQGRFVHFTMEMVISDTADNGWTVASPILSMPIEHTNIINVRGTVTAYAGKEKENKGYLLTRRTDDGNDQLVEVDLDDGSITVHSPGESVAPPNANANQIIPIGVKDGKGYLATRRTDDATDEIIEIDLSDGSVTKYSNDELVAPTDALAEQIKPLGMSSGPQGYSTTTRTTGIGTVVENNNKLQILFEKLERSEQDVLIIASGSYRLVEA